MCERPILPQISQITQTNHETPKQPLPQTNCLSLRDNAACCIPLRDLRYLRENIHMRVLNQSANKKPQYLPQIPLIYADKPQNSLYLKQTVFLCEIMQLAAFVCVICVICGRIFTQEDSIYQRENKQHIICETHINDKEGCALAHPSPIILQSIPCS